MGRSLKYHTKGSNSHIERSNGLPNTSIVIIPGEKKSWKERLESLARGRTLGGSHKRFASWSKKRLEKLSETTKS